MKRFPGLSSPPQILLPAVLICCCLNARAEKREIEYDKIPAKFEQYQDQKGFLWQTNKEGSLTSGETQYLPSGLKIFLDGKAFVPETATLREESDQRVLDLAIPQKGETFTVQRQQWFDLERGGVRLIDSIKNSGNTAKVKIELKTAFQFPWQNLVGNTGRILSGTTNVEIPDRTPGIVAKFSVADGRQDSIIIFGGEDAATKPKVSASANSRELVLTYELTIPEGKTVSLVHWLLRRNIGQLDEIEKEVSTFYDRKQLNHPRVSDAESILVQNFAPSTFPSESGPPANLNQLVVLNELLERVNISRSDQDILWLSSSNQLRGQVDEKSEISVGGIAHPIGKIAAIEGGGGIGKTPRVFFRDGTVKTGAIEVSNFALKVGNSWAVETLSPDQLKFLLLKFSKNDGSVPAKTVSFFELRSGEVLTASSTKSPVPLVSVWGRKEVLLEEIDELQYLSIPRPEYRLVHADGSSLSVLPTSEPIVITTSEGITVSIAPRSIRRIWKTGVSPTPLEAFEPRWLEIDEVPKGLLPQKGFLLQGNNVYAGTFTGAGSLTLIDDNSALDIAPSQIISMRKIDTSLRSSLPQFEVELMDGNLVKGGINQATLSIGNKKENWQIPVRHIIAYHAEGGGK